MTLVVAVLAILQGVSEFLPISSSAHLLIAPWLFHWTDPGLAFDAAIHLGTALALVVYFWPDLWTMLRKRDRLIGYLAVATIPGALFGYLGDQWIESTFHSSSWAPLLVGISMIVFSLLLYLIDHHAKLRRTIASVKLHDAIWLGLGQTLALMPGVSRSGATISTGLLLGLKREDAARFSFLLAIPITIGAGSYSALKVLEGKASTSVSHLQLLLGIALSALVGWAVIKWFMRYLNHHNLNIFVYYRIVLALLVIAIWLIRR